MALFSFGFFEICTIIGNKKKKVPAVDCTSSVTHLCYIEF